MQQRQIKRPKGMKQPQVRLYRSQDRTAILRAVRDLQEYERWLHKSRRRGGEVAKAYLDTLFRRTSESSGAILVAELNGIFVGFIACWISRNTSLMETPDFSAYGYVSDIFVDPKHRRRGVGTTLLQAAERHLSSSGVRRLRLNVLAANTSAQAAYRRYGFEPYEISMDKPMRFRNQRKNTR